MFCSAGVTAGAGVVLFGSVALTVGLSFAESVLIEHEFYYYCTTYCYYYYYVRYYYYYLLLLRYLLLLLVVGSVSLLLVCSSFVLFRSVSMMFAHGDVNIS